MIDQALHEKIENYLLGKMTPEEAASFEADIENDPQLAEEVELHRLILPVPDRLAELDLRQDFTRWRDEMEPDPPPAQPSPQTRYFNIWSAVILLLLLAGAFGIWQYYETQLAEERSERIRIEKELEAEKLRSENLEKETRQLRNDILEMQKSPVIVTPPSPAVVKPPPVPDTLKKEPEYVALADEELIAYADNISETLRTRGARSEAKGEELADKADTAIVNKKYRAALNLLTQISSDDPMYPKSREMLAYVYFKRRQYSKAVEAYRKYRTFDGNTDKTDWELCIFYLADYPRYKSEFQPLLQKILDDAKHPLQSKAGTLRQALADKGIWPK